MDVFITCYASEMRRLKHKFIWHTFIYLLPYISKWNIPSDTWNVLSDFYCFVCCIGIERGWIITLKLIKFGVVTLIKECLRPNLVIDKQRTSLIVTKDLYCKLPVCQGEYTLCYTHALLPGWPWQMTIACEELAVFNVLRLNVFSYIYNEVLHSSIHFKLIPYGMPFIHRDSIRHIWFDIACIDRLKTSLCMQYSCHKPNMGVNAYGIQLQSRTLWIYQVPHCCQLRAFLTWIGQKACHYDKDKALHPHIK